MRMRSGLAVAVAALLALPSASVPQTYRAPRHTLPPSPLIFSGQPVDLMFRADAGMQMEQDRSPAGELEEHRKLERALKGLSPQRPGVVDAYLVSIALDSDPVFGREARGAAAVLSRRYGAAGRSVVLAGSDGSSPSPFPRGSPATLGVVLARVAELMEKREDVLILYTTSHGAPIGLLYHDADNGYGAVSPSRLAIVLDELGLANRMLILSACHAGIFVPRLQNGSAAIVTAAAADRTSFGCAADNDWTFFGDALVNNALRKPQPLAAAFGEAQALISSWEGRAPARPSLPQMSVGPNAARWLAVLEGRVPKTATQPVGKPAFAPAAATPPAR